MLWGTCLVTGYFLQFAYMWAPPRKRVCCYGCCISQERINVSAVPKAPHVFFQPLSLYLVYYSVHSEIQWDDWSHEQDDQQHKEEMEKSSRRLVVNGRKWKKVKVKSLSSVRLFATPLPGSSVHGIFQARVLEWVAISFSRGSSQPRDRTQGSNPGLPNPGLLNPGLPHCMQTLYHLSHRGFPSKWQSWDSNPYFRLPSPWI